MRLDVYFRSLCIQILLIKPELCVIEIFLPNDTPVPAGGTEDMVVLSELSLECERGTLHVFGMKSFFKEVVR